MEALKILYCTCFIVLLISCGGGATPERTPAGIPTPFLTPESTPTVTLMSSPTLPTTFQSTRQPTPTVVPISASPAPPAQKSIVAPFANQSVLLEETGSMKESESTHALLWLNSGAYLGIKNGTGVTVKGDLPEHDKWRLAYLASNPVDTDKGFRPQNIFRLVVKQQWENIRQEMRFSIEKVNESASPERDAWSGAFFMSRYIDGDNLYYAGVRHDGAAVIKKKIDGTYYDMDYRPVFVEKTPYNRETNPNLLPILEEIGMKVEVITQEGDKAVVRLFIDKEGSGNWQLIAEGVDDGVKYGGPIHKNGFAGLRSDFSNMDFIGYKIQEAP